MQNKFDVVFQGMTDEVEAWAQSYSDAIGRNKNDIKTYLADQQNLLVGFGMTRQEGAELSKQMTTLALDLASFANLDETAAVNNMTKAVMGESEAAKALGAVLNDDTRARAMQAMGLSGTYEKLDQLTKMQVNYNAILAQSPDAIGDCERSLGSYKSTVVQFQSKLKEIKTLVGQFFMPTFQKVISFGAKGLTVLRDGVQKLNDFAAKIGGAEKIIGVLGVTIGATLAIVNFQKISNGLKLIGKGLSNVNLKVFAIAAVVLMLALIVQDFIAFMNGDNSVIGALFEKAGIDADEARATIQKAWSTIKDFLLSIWGTLQGAAQAIFGALSDWWAENGESVKETLLGIWKAIVGAAKQIFGALSGWWKENGAQVMETFSKLWEGIKQLCETLWNALVSAAQTIFGALKAFWDTWGSTIIAVFSILWNTLISLIQPFLDFLSAVIDFLANVFTGNWEGAWNAIKDMAAAAWEMLVTILGGAWDTITTIWGAVIDFFAGIFQGVWDVIVEKVTGIKDAIVNGFQAAIDWITALPEQALKWGSDIVDNIVNGITGAVGKVGELAVLLLRHADEIAVFLLLRFRLRRLLGLIPGLFRPFLLRGRGRNGRRRGRWGRRGEPSRFLLCFPGPTLSGRILLPLVDEAVVHLLPFIPVVQIQVAVELIYPAGLDHAVNHLGRLHSVRETGTGGNDISYVPPVCLQDHSVPFGVINPPGPYGEERTGGLVSGEPG